jgi:NRPS condensation-like uncharacterized protein
LLLFGFFKKNSILLADEDLHNLVILIKSSSSTETEKNNCITTEYDIEQTNTLKTFSVTAQDAYNFVASKVFADQQLCMVLKFSGRIDETSFARALLLTLNQEPVLGSKFVENGGSPYWEHRDDLEKVRICSVLETSYPEQEMLAFINEATHADADPLVTSRIFREKEADTVCIKVNHSACDAGGLKEYVSILSDFYSRLREDPDYSVRPNLCGRRDQSQVFENIKNLERIEPKGGPSPTWTFPQKDGITPLHSIRHIPRERFGAIKNYAHKKKATINDLLLTALYRTLFEINNTVHEMPMTVQVSIDLRRYCPDNKVEAICNLSGALYLGMERIQGEVFEKTLDRTAAVMNKLKEDYPGIESAKGLEYMYGQGYPVLEKWLMESGAQSRKYQVTYPLLSNFGVLKDYNFGGLHTVKGYITSPVMYPPGFMLGVSTYNEEMTLSIGYCGQENSRQVESFLDAYMEQLPR